MVKVPLHLYNDNELRFLIFLQGPRFHSYSILGDFQCYCHEILQIINLIYGMHTRTGNKISIYDHLSKLANAVREINLK
jgi:hypothetical protein